MRQRGALAADHPHTEDYNPLFDGFAEARLYLGEGECGGRLMRIWQLAAVVFSVFAAVAFGASPAAAQGKPEIVIRVCNNSGYPANVAVSYQPVGSGRFYNEGWFGVSVGGCVDVGRTDNAYFYAYAEVINDGSRFWAGDHGLCVVYPGPYRFWSDNSQYCGSGQTLRNFVVLHANDFGVYTWTLNP